MIKINLLSEGKRPTAVRRTAKPAAGVESENIALIMLIVTFLLPVLIAGAVYYKFHLDLVDKQQEVADAQAEVERLRSVLQEVEEFKAKKAELEHKIQVINDLRDNQRGPVQVMDSISRALPELLWLDRMEMGPSQISLTGRAFNFNAIANLAENLDEVPEFREPNLKDSSQRGQIFDFSLTFNYDYTRRSSQEGSAAGDGVDGEEPAAAAPAAAGLR